MYRKIKVYSEIINEMKTKHHNHNIATVQSK